MILVRNFNLVAVEEFLRIPEIFKQVYGQSNSKESIIDDTKIYLSAFRNKKQVKQLGCFMVKELTKVVLEVHLAMHPSIWGKPEIDEIVELGLKWAKEAGYRKLFCKVPANYGHILNLLKRHGYQPCGMVSEGIIYNNRLVPLLFFDKQL